MKPCHNSNTKRRHAYCYYTVVVLLRSLSTRGAQIMLAHQFTQVPHNTNTYTHECTNTNTCLATLDEATNMSGLLGGVTAAWMRARATLPGLA